MQIGLKSMSWLQLLHCEQHKKLRKYSSSFKNDYRTMFLHQLLPKSVWQNQLKHFVQINWLQEIYKKQYCIFLLVIWVLHILYISNIYNKLSPYIFSIKLFFKHFFNHCTQYTKKIICFTILPMSDLCLKASVHIIPMSILTQCVF